MALNSEIKTPHKIDRKQLTKREKRIWTETFEVTKKPFVATALVRTHRTKV